MLKRFIPVAGALALMLAIFAGCQDSPTTGPQSPTSATVADDQYTAYFVPDQALNDAADAPSFDQVMNDQSFLTPPPTDPGRGGKDSAEHRDTTRKDTANHGGKGPGGPGGPGRGDTTHNKRPDTLQHRGPKDSVEHHGNDSADHHGKDSADNHGKDSLRLRPINYGDIISKLHPTKEQDSAIRMCFRDLNDCTRSAAMRYRDALKGLRDSLQAALREIRAAVDAGRITRDEAKARIDRLTAQYRRDAGALEAAYRQAVDTCRQEFERCVASHLTPEQLVVWQRLTHH